MQSSIKLLRLLCILFIGSTALTAQTVRKVPSQYGTIQAAITASGSGDTIEVAPGTYRENIDFLGRNVLVTATAGPTQTTIDGGAAGSVVSFRSGEGPKAILAGFTLTNGRASRGAGIFCTNASPTIRGNHIINNTAGGALSCFGGGIYCSLAGPTIERNLIKGNFVGDTGGNPVNGYGGGLYLAETTATVASNVVAENRAQAGGSGINWGSAAAGGLYALYGSTVVVNNTIIKNYCFDIDFFNPGTGGVVISSFPKPGSHVLANTIIRENANPRGPSQLSVSNTTVSYCNIEGGYSGTGNIDLDPRFGVNYQIRFLSPCRDRGTRAVSGLPAKDYEGDPRIVYGTPDIGADEFNYHLYSAGVPKPGSSVYIKMTGPPSAPVIWAYSVNTPLRSTPLPIPGAGNPLWLNNPVYPLILGPMPASGEIILAIYIPASVPTPISVPQQALVGTWLTNPMVITITP